MNGNKVKLNILGLTYSQIQAGAYALILTEEGNESRRIPVIIGTPEAQSIAIYLEGLKPPRPLTHDLFITLIKSLDIPLKEVFIYKYEDGVFYSELVFSHNETELRIDSRTSDAIALAIRMDSPIYIAPNILSEVAVETENSDFMEELDSEITISTLPSLENQNLEELQNSLEEAIREENYEKASFIRDLIQRKGR